MSITAVGGEATLNFVPTADWSGKTEFKYQALDNADAKSVEATANIEVTPVTDVPEVSITIGTPENQIQHINISNVNVGASDKNFEVTAFSNGIKGEISRIDFDVNVGGGKVNGFGVSGKANANNNSAAWKEIDSHEVIRVDFEQPVTDLSVKFSWLADNELAKYTLYDNKGNVLGSEIVRGQTDRIDAAYNISEKFPDAQISRVEFTAAEGNGNDYVIHEISYSGIGAKTYPLVIETSPTDVDGSEKIISIIVKVPEGAALSHGTLIGTEDGISSWQLSLENNQGYTVTSTNNQGGIKIEGISVTIAATDNIEIEVIATAQEKEGNTTPESADATAEIINSVPAEEAPSIDVISAGTVAEGEVLKFTISLDKSVDYETQVTFTLGDGANDRVDAADIGPPSVTIGGRDVTLTSNGNGSYSFNVPAGTESGIEVSVPTVNDGLLENAEQLTLHATLTGETAAGLILPVGITSAGTGTIADESYIAEQNSDNTFNGGAGNDVLLGDSGGVSSTVTPGTNYNISLILDTSGSMGNASGTGGLSRLALAIQALGNLVTQLKVHDGIINLQLVDFSKNANSITINNLDANNISDLTTYLGKLTANGGTNYEAAFKKAADWFGDQSSQTGTFENVSFFLTDGKPTYYLDNKDKVAGNGSATNYDTFKNSVDEFNALSGVSLVHAIGIGSNIAEEYLQFFDNSLVTGTGTVKFDGKKVTGNVGSVDIVNTAEDLDVALQSSSTSHELLALGDDIIDGGSGSDIIFGDAINTDNLDWGNIDKPANLPDGSGIFALKALLKIENGHDATEEELYNYIREHHESLNIEGDERGGNDTIDGGAGNDIIYGQGGDDTIHGGAGNDTINAGTGADHITGGLGNDIIDLGGGPNGDGEVDIVYWTAEDAAAGKQSDTITSFELGTDKLDFNDFFTDNEKNNLEDYLSVEKVGGDILVKAINGQGAELDITLSNVIDYDTNVLNSILIQDLLNPSQNG
ncbi:VWA domain-containing protein [Oceanisphaera sp. W20_SRM_FM3]|uniref:VWA domain-containing protein n=1 Tax=Oceanisphaera sp. W20_SRM_FM3 TaxID=3240267 RepID=UPI003F978D24